MPDTGTENWDEDQHFLAVFGGVKGGKKSKAFCRGGLSHDQGLPKAQALRGAQEKRAAVQPGGQCGVSPAQDPLCRDRGGAGGGRGGEGCAPPRASLFRLLGRREEELPSESPPKGQGRGFGVA